MSLLLDSTIKVSFLVLFALAGSAVLRKQSAAVRHWVLSMALACAAVIPVLAVVVPPWSLPLSIPASSRLEPAPTTGLSIEIQVVERPNQPGDRAVLPQEASAPVQGPGSATFSNREREPAPRADLDSGCCGEPLHADRRARASGLARFTFSEDCGRGLGRAGGRRRAPVRAATSHPVAAKRPSDAVGDLGTRAPEAHSARRSRCMDEGPHSRRPFS